jgi:hypothetical protein
MRTPEALEVLYNDVADWENDMQPKLHLICIRWNVRQ